MRRSGAVLFLLILACCLPASAAAASAPTIEYSAPSPLRNHEATLRFAVNPNGLDTSYEVEYGFEAGDYFEYNYPWDRELPAGTEPVAGKAEIPAHFEAKLQPATEYHWRVVATNSAGTTTGPDQVFTTPDEPPPVFTTGAVTVLAPTSVVFEGTVDPEGNPLTGCRFRWVSDTTHTYAGFEKSYGGPPNRFGETVPCAESAAEIGFGTDPVTVHAEATITTPGVYWVRLEGDNAYEDAVDTTNFGVEFDTRAPLVRICGSGQGCTSTSDPLTETVPTSSSPAAAIAAAPQLKKKQRKKPALKKKRRQLRHNAAIVAPRPR